MSQKDSTLPFLARTIVWAVGTNLVVGLNEEEEEEKKGGRE